MNFKYKNLSKGLLCMLMPILAGCNSSRTPSDKDIQINDAKHTYDSINTLYNNAVISEQCYINCFEMIAKDYQDNYKNGRAKNKALSEYQIDKLSQISDSLDFYRSKEKHLAKKLVTQQIRIDHLQKSK